MANYAVTDYNTGKVGSISAALAALETKLETIDNSKTIRYIDVKSDGADWQGVLIYDA
jgi:hypothetical protein